MPGMKRLHILLPGQPDAGPGLAGLLARGRPSSVSAPGITAAIAQLFDLDQAAIAPILLAAEGYEPGDGRWFRADPVHLLAGMHSLSLLDGHRFQLDAAESLALIAALNSHFAGELEFIAPRPTRWYAHFNQPMQVFVPPLDQVAGTMLDLRQITGPDATRLQGLTMEIQMRLHDQPVNDLREQRGELPINSVWFWGGGTYRQPRCAFDQVLTDDFTATALARAAAIPCRPLPDHFLTVEGHTLVVFDDSANPEKLDADWFQPILRSLKWRQMDEVILELAGPDGYQLRLDPWLAWQFWRRPKAGISG